MCNTHKRIRGCKDNRELTTVSFRDYVIGFCEHQEHQRVEKCTECGGSSLCEKVIIEESCVRGVFVCADCGYQMTLRVDMPVLRERFDKMRLQRVNRGVNMPIRTRKVCGDCGSVTLYRNKHGVYRCTRCG